MEPEIARGIQWHNEFVLFQMHIFLYLVAHEKHQSIHIESMFIILSLFPKSKINSCGQIGHITIYFTDTH